MILEGLSTELRRYYTLRCKVIEAGDPALTDHSVL